MAEGSIYKRNDGRWCGQITVGRDPKTGKRNRKYVYGDTKREVSEKLTEIKHKIYSGTYIEPSNIKLSEWLICWINGRKNSLAENTYKGYKSIIKNHINPVIGNIKLKKLKARAVQNLLNEKLENGRVDNKGGLSHRTVKYIYQTLHAALDQAVKEKLISSNICKAVEIPQKQEEKEMRTWSAEQVNKFLETAKNFKYYILHYLALNTGLRQGELLGLKWQDFKFEKLTLNVIRQYGRSLEFKKLKTKAGKRVIPLTQNIIKELKKHKVEQSERKLSLGEAFNDNDLVCCDLIGNPINHRSLYKEFKRVVEAAKLPDIRFHDLRHTFATNYLETGGDITVLQKMLGHSSITVTIDTYSHVSKDMLKNAANIINQMYKQNKTKNNNIKNKNTSQNK